MKEDKRSFDPYGYVNSQYGTNYKPGMIVRSEEKNGFLGQVQNRRNNNHYVLVMFSDGVKGEVHPLSLTVVE